MTRELLMSAVMVAALLAPSRSLRNMRRVIAHCDEVGCVSGRRRLRRVLAAAERKFLSRRVRDRKRRRLICRVFLGERIWLLRT